MCGTCLGKLAMDNLQILLEDQNTFPEGMIDFSFSSADFHTLVCTL